MKAPEKIPGKFYNDYVMDGTAIMEYRYFNDCSDETQKLFNDNFTQEVFSNYLQKAENKERNYYGPTDDWLYEALQKYPLTDKSICIIGSANPWYEAIAISHGVSNCTVIEYSKRESFHDKIIYKQPHEMKGEKFDVCFSISSIEHDGLGRYGDPLNPIGDIEAMEKTRELLHEDGLLFLAVPIGLDKVVFNAHRVYGKNRIDKLLKGWTIADQFGFFEDSFDNNINGVNGTPYQPLYVLKAE